MVISIIDLTDPVDLIDGIADYLDSEKFKYDVSNDSEALKDLADCVVGLQCYFEQLEVRVPFAGQILEHCEAALVRIGQSEFVSSVNESKQAETEAKIEVDSESDVDLDFDMTMLSSEEELDPGFSDEVDNSTNQQDLVEGSFGQHKEIEAFDVLPDLNSLADELTDPEGEVDDNKDDGFELVVDGASELLVADLNDENEHDEKVNRNEDHVSETGAGLNIPLMQQWSKQIQYWLKRL